MLKLIDAKTEEEIQLPARRTMWNGSVHVIEEFKLSRFKGIEGLVRTSLNEGFKVSAFGLKIVETAL